MTDYSDAPTKRNAPEAAQAKKPKAKAYIPTKPVERQEARARYRGNLAAILPLMEAGAAVLPLAGKRPLAIVYQRADADISAAAADYLDAWRQDKGLGEDAVPSHGIGSTRTPARLRDWPHVNDELAFGLSLGPMGVQVVDCDDEGGAKFLAFLAEHGEPLDLARTPAIMSPSRRGLHLYFANPAGNGGRKLAGLSLDLKAWGGQVVAPGQTIPPKFDEDGTLRPAGTYVPVPGSLDLATALRDGTLPPLPACFVQYLIDHPGSSGGSATDEEAIADALDALAAGPAGDKPERDVAALVDELRAEVPAFDKLWTQGHTKGDRSAGRIALANHMAARYGSAGFDVHDLADAYALWSEAFAGEPRDRDIGREYGKAVRGGNVGASDGSAFGAVEVETPTDAATLDAAMADILGMDTSELPDLDGRQQLDALVAQHNGTTADAPKIEDDGKLPAEQQRRKDALAYKNRPLKFESLGDLLAQPFVPTRWLVKGLIEAETLFTLIGDAGAGKSLVVLDMLLRVAHGLPWAGRKTERGGVLYVCPEGPNGIKRRLDAWCRRQAVEGHDLKAGAFDLCRMPLDLFNGDKHLGEIEARIATFEARFGVPCSMVVIDTLRQAIPGADESSARDVGQFTAKLNALRDRTGAACGFVHHAGKDSSRGASGSTALIGNVDVALAAKWDKKTRRGELDAIKLRDGELTAPIGYAIHAVEVGTDEDGESVTGGVAEAGIPIRADRSGKGAERAAGGASTGEAFGAADEVDDGETAADLGDVPQPPDPRLAVLREIVEEQGAGGEKVVRRDVAPALAARLRKRKLPAVKDTKLKEYLAELVEDGILIATGSGPGSGYRLAAPTEG